jgi:hypothetical protein
MAIIQLQRQPSGLEIIGNALAGVLQKKQEQQQQQKNIEAMSNVYDSLYNNTPKPSYSFDPNKFSITNPNNVQSSLSQYLTGVDPNQSVLTKPVNQIMPMPQSSTPGRNPYAAVLSVLKNNPNINPSMVLPIAMQWEQEKKAESQKTINQAKMQNALSRVQQAIAAGKSGSEIALAALQAGNEAGQNIDTNYMNMILKPMQKDFGFKDTGGSIIGYEYSQNGGFKPVTAIPKEASPESRLSAETAKYTHDTPSGSSKLSAQTQLQVHSTPSGTAILNAGQKNKTSKELSDGDRAVLKHFENTYKYDGKDLDRNGPENDPLYPRYQAIMGRLANQGIQQGNANQAGNNDQVADWINKARMAGAEPEQIKQKLRERGYGDTYDSYVW